MIAISISVYFLFASFVSISTRLARGVNLETRVERTTMQVE